MEEFEQCSDAWNPEWKSSYHVRGLESGMEEFVTSLMIGIGNGGVRAKFRCLESEIEEFESCSNSSNREWRSSSQVRSLELEKEEFETNSKLGIGNGGVRVKFRGW